MQLFAISRLMSIVNRWPHFLWHFHVMQCEFKEPHNGGPTLYQLSIDPAETYFFVVPPAPADELQFVNFKVPAQLWQILVVTACFPCSYSSVSKDRGRQMFQHTETLQGDPPTTMALRALHTPPVFSSTR